MTYLQKVCQLTNTKLEDLMSKSRKDELVLVRQSVSFSLYPILNYRELSELFGRYRTSSYKWLAKARELESIGDEKFLAVYEKVKEVKWS